MYSNRVPFYEDSQKQKELKAGEESCSKIIFSTFYEYKNMQRKCVFEFSKSIILCKKLTSVLHGVFSTLPSHPTRLVSSETTHQQSNQRHLKLKRGRSAYDLNPLSAKPTKWSNTLKQFVDSSLNRLRVFENFAVLALKGLNEVSDQPFS